MTSLFGSTTSIEEEKEFQDRWKLRRKGNGGAVFEQTLANEFLLPDRQRENQDKATQRIVEHAAVQVPYYRELLADLGLSAGDLSTVESLTQLPILDRETLQDRGDRLLAETLPRGEEIGGQSQTSGSTGQPVKVMQTRSSLGLFRIFIQKGYRWFRFDPAGKMAQIRPNRELPPKRPGQLLEIGDSGEYSQWPALGDIFETGPAVGFRNNNSLEDQLDWLDRHQPDYLLTQSANLEHLAFGYQDRPVPESLKGLVAISQQMTPEMESMITGVFGLPVNMNYGLNEIGIVAIRCPQAGNFHINTGFCTVEIVDEDGNACREGQMGRLIVTGLMNPAMPLIRYDTSDLAIASSEQCSCGRTTPIFRSLEGRYRRMTCLPEGAWQRIGVIQNGIEKMDGGLRAGLRQYQLHLFRDGRFELRLATAFPLDPGFHQRIEEKWREFDPDADPPPLDLVEMEEIPRGNRRKFESFTSDFFD